MSSEGGYHRQAYEVRSCSAKPLIPVDRLSVCSGSTLERQLTKHLLSQESPAWQPMMSALAKRGIGFMTRLNHDNINPCSVPMIP